MAEPALLIIDVQKGLDDPALGHRNNPDAESRMAMLLDAWRKHGRPVIHIQHNSVEPGSTLRPELPGNAIKDEVKPLAGETLFTKTVNSAFIGTGLERHLKEKGIDSLVVVGLTTEHCISTSVRMAANLGFDVTLVSDATAAFEHRAQDGSTYSADQVHDVNLVSLDGEFCRVRLAEQVLASVDSR